MIKQSRRDFVLSGSAFALTGAVAGLVGLTSVSAQSKLEGQLKGVKALFFDVFGTLVD